MEASLNEQKSPLKSHVYLQWNRKWENILLHSIKDAVKTLNVPSAETKMYKQISFTSLGQFNDNCKELTIPELYPHLGKTFFRFCSNVALLGDRIHFTVHNTASGDFENVMLAGVELNFIGNDGRFSIVRNRSSTCSKTEAQFMVDLSSKRMMIVTDQERRTSQNLDSCEWKITGSGLSEAT